MHTATVRSVQTYGAFCTLEGYDKDGLLQTSELVAGLGSSDSAQLVLSVDIDRSGSVNIAEWLQYLRTRCSVACLATTLPQPAQWWTRMCCMHGADDALPPRTSVFA